MAARSDINITAIDFYWRPGCGFCMSLNRKLEKAGVSVSRHNIWEDEKARAYVRSVARGSETVPIVTVGRRAMVNPTAREVMATLADRAPHLLRPEPEPTEGSGARRRVGQLVDRLLGR